MCRVECKHTYPGLDCLVWPVRAHLTLDCLVWPVMAHLMLVIHQWCTSCSHIFYYLSPSISLQNFSIYFLSFLSIYFHILYALKTHLSTWLLLLFIFFTIFYYTHEHKRNKYQMKHGEDRVVIWKTWRLKRRIILSVIYIQAIFPCNFPSWPVDSSLCFTSVLPPSQDLLMLRLDKGQPWCSMQGQNGL